MEGLDGLTLGLIIGGSVLALIAIFGIIWCVMKSRQARHGEVQKHPLPSEDSTQKSNIEMTTQPNGDQADDQ